MYLQPNLRTFGSNFLGLSQFSILQPSKVPDFRWLVPSFSFCSRKHSGNGDNTLKPPFQQNGNITDERTWLFGMISLEFFPCPSLLHWFAGDCWKYTKIPSFLVKGFGCQRKPIEEFPRQMIAKIKTHALDRVVCPLPCPFPKGT